MNTISSVFSPSRADQPVDLEDVRKAVARDREKASTLDPQSPTRKLSFDDLEDILDAQDGSGSTRRITTEEFGSSDPNDPVDGTVNKRIQEWLAAGNKAEWKSMFGMDSPSLGDSQFEVEEGRYGRDLFLTGLENKEKGLDPRRKQVLPHRGLFDNSTGVLENTISAADNAFKHGFRGVELDLRASKEGDAWMMHDATIGRVTGDPDNRLISEVSSKELAEMDLSVWNPVTNQRTPALDRNGKPQKMETLQDIIDYVREKKKNGEEFNVVIDPKDEASTLRAIEALSLPENADIRDNLGIKIYSTYVPSTDSTVLRMEHKTSKVLDSLTQANKTIGNGGKLNLIPVLIKTEDVTASVIDDAPVEQAVDWLTSFARLGDLSMVEISRFEGTDNFNEMNEVAEGFKAAGEQFSNTTLTMSYISEAFSVNGEKFYYSHHGVPIMLPNRPDMDFRATFGALAPYADVLVSDNPFLETLYVTGWITDGNHADYTFPIDKHYNPASIIDSPPDFIGKPSWRDNPRRRLVDDHLG